MGTPSDTHHPFSGAHFMLWPSACPRYFPIAKPSRFFTFSLIPVAAHHLFRARVAYFSSLICPSIRVVSSANCEILYHVPFTSIPRIRFSCITAMFSASAHIRKSRGLRGHPWATPLRM